MIQKSIIPLIYLAVLTSSLLASVDPPHNSTSQENPPKPAAIEKDPKVASDSKKPRKKGEKQPSEKAVSKKRPLKPAGSDEAAEEPRPETIGHPFSWPFIGWEKMKPRGGTTQGSQTTLASEANPAFYRIQERGITPKERDRRAILALAGDFRVSFDFIETASSAFPYTPPRPYFSWATECAFVIEDQPDFISIQHILVMEFVDESGEIQGPFTMKHWRQDWTYQDRRTFRYLGDRTWQSQIRENSSGQWSQAVYQVDDSPRYETTGRWDHRGGISVFRSGSFWRPLPRREFSLRDDYNVLGGHHEITVTPSGWLHTQINRKIVAHNGKIEKVIAHELGADRYERISSPSLAPAHEYWKATSAFWSAVRRKWDAVLEDKAPVRLRKDVDDKPMFAHLFALAGQLEDGEIDKKQEQKLIKEALTIIDRFIERPEE
ncbi:DUF6607 family protein [Haloferula chungangensis]|uniref:DUF6607 family protein n=1 Tax=Haloferula chungangensis TaxID=1048331 RepID=A0ABW2L927_9BACT